MGSDGGIGLGFWAQLRLSSVGFAAICIGFHKRCTLPHGAVLNWFHVFSSVCLPVCIFGISFIFLFLLLFLANQTLASLLNLSAGLPLLRPRSQLGAIHHYHSHSRCDYRLRSTRLSPTSSSIVWPLPCLGCNGNWQLGTGSW